MSRIVDIEPLLHKYDGMNEGTEFSPIHFINDLMALEQESITWIVGKDNSQVAVRNMPIDKVQKICAIIREEEPEPCEDYICRAEALKVMRDKCPMHNCVAGCSSYRHIEKLPSVKPKQKVGKWILHEDYHDEYHYECSECGQRINWVDESDHYCCNCGARMEGSDVR